MLAGVAAFVAALVVGGLASRVMPARTLVGVAELEPQRVRQPILKTGIYSRTRNPIYLAHWLLIFSMAALSGFAASWILFAVDCLIIPLMILSEERELRARYGQEFKTYMSHVPRFFPKL
jgi:protein-S-isoprenylcysteine O-methyltransferase Ste14